MDCRRCDDTLSKLKTAQWDKHLMEKERNDVVQQSARIIRWLSLKHIAIPDNNELERMYPTT